MEITQAILRKGGDFLTTENEEGAIYSPENFTEEHQMIKSSVDEFVETQIFPNAEKIEKMENNIAADMLEMCGDLGFLGAHMPEEYNGMDLDFISNALIAEGIGCAGSFSVPVNAHVGIGMLPVYYFGTPEQKSKYLTGLSTGQLKAAYCLTEPGAGSDALSGKTRAILNDSKTHYIINGQKMWISNAGFADLFTVFAQVDGDKFTAFLVEKGTPGLSLGEEERKMGIKGSSTRMVFLENVEVPVENVLGDIGKGHLIAFNSLNIGRYKLGISCLGGAKKVTTKSIEYANERIQFGVPIASFGAIKSKIAQQSIKCFATESVSYRIAKWMNDEIENQLEKGETKSQAKLKAADEFALECSILKILGSEILDYVVDENVQIHGGMGFSEEGTAARAYRDSRINRIFEGTNEINRLLMINRYFKKVLGGDIDLAKAALNVQAELQNGTKKDYSNFAYSAERAAVDNLKKLNLMFLGFAGQLSMQKTINLKEEQEILMALSDLMNDAYTLESTLLRVEKLNKAAKDSMDVYESILKALCQESMFKSYTNAMNLCSMICPEEMTGLFVRGIKTLTKYPLQNQKTHYRKVADHMIALNEYKL